MKVYKIKNLQLQQWKYGKVLHQKLMKEQLLAIELINHLKKIKKMLYVLFNNSYYKQYFQI